MDARAWEVLVGERFGRSVALSEDEVSAYARAAGDPNPLHHDAGRARSSRFGGPIVSGPQSSGLMMGAVVARLASVGAVIGRWFWFDFRRPLPVGGRFRIEWLVVRVEPRAPGRGAVVELRGRILGADGLTAVRAKGAVVVHR